MLPAPADLLLPPLAPSDKVLVAVSGGLDSVVLLHLLLQAKVRVAVAHCNFGLRGAESDADEQFVKELALRHNVPFHSTRFGTEETASEAGVSIQMAARDLRYTWFNELLQQHGYRYLATAHHLNDSMETLLLNLVRGTGPAGLAGIAAQSGQLLRPLVKLPRAQLEDYARHHQLQWRDDSSNASDYYKRNFIRHRVVPLLQELNPNLAATLSQTMQRMQDATELLQEQTSQYRQTAQNTKGQQVIIQTAVLPKKGTALLLHNLLKPFGFTYLQAQEIGHSLQGHSGKQFFSGSHRLLIDRKQLLIEPLSATTTLPEAWLQPGDAEADLGHALITQRLLPRKVATIVADPATALLDATKLEYPLQIRLWQPGDKIRPLGMQGLKKVSDLLIDRKVPLTEKEKVLVVLSGSEIIWVAGHRVSELYKLTEATKSVVELHLHPKLPSGF